MTSIVKQSDQSPFDAIRHFDGNGNEFWSARELMSVFLPGLAKKPKRVFRGNNHGFQRIPKPCPRRD
jgi:surfactin synthase thioesterase subunit